MVEGLVAIYRWRVPAEHEAEFREGWTTVTRQAAERGGLGSCLSRADDGDFVALALWPDRQARQEAFQTIARQPGMAHGEPVSAMDVDVIEDRWSVSPFNSTRKFARADASPEAPPSNASVTPVDLFRVLVDLWAADTASPGERWEAQSPAKNHCSVTSLIVQDQFGGEILRTKTVGGTHFYNLINGKKWDLTVSQFNEPIAFDDTPASRSEALADCGDEKYHLLSGRLKERLGSL